MQRPLEVWSQEGACRGLSPRDEDTIFFKKSGRPRKEPLYKRFCGACPVVIECKMFALVHNEKGTWGNTTEKERSRLPESYILELRQQAIREGWFIPTIKPSLVANNQPISSTEAGSYFEGVSSFLANLSFNF